MSFTPYLSFQGECADAFARYAELFGGTAQVMRFSDAPPNPQMPALPDDQKNWAMHAQLTLPDGAVLMGADMPPQFGGVPQAGVSIAVSRDTDDAARALFDGLAQGGTVIMPFLPTFFAKGFGMCKDRFGTSWMVSFGMEDTK
ncbi:VOC family protein [Paracoccus sp. (in: a-proteobacteria)]|uniref:VOC family protein n=1 Tax=Paracoccus sp. TaxID=267 RepID=UPI0026DF6409|nr:VOC family protein [Paracoccus sp. (in: a-proteobacteria)]MDO5648088.1 VOC family protein [Paracoccus sp. (in: a-proteobacteria)]